jgi:hypothetical protein
MYSNTLTSISGDDLLIAPSYGNDLILEVSANNNIFFKKGRITKNFDNLISEVSFNSLTSQVEYILQEISGSSALNLITSGISNDLLIKSYEGQDIILEVSGNSEIIFKRGDISYNLDDLIGGGSQSSDYATYNILDITGKIIFTDNSTNAQQNGGGYSSSSNIILTSISGNIIPAVNNTFKLGDVSKNWSNAYITDLSVSNIDVSGRLNVAGATKLSNTLEISGNVTIGGPTLYVPSSFTIDPIGYDNNTGTVLINGNLVVQGLTTTINSSVVDISDKMLVLASNASNSLQADGAGFEISGAKVNLLYNNSSNTFSSSIGLTISGNVVPTSNSVGSLGESGKLWDIAYVRELNVTNFTNSIDGANITQGTISSTQIANGSILTVDISDHAITYAKIAVDAVTTTRIENGAVTHAKLSSHCVESHNIVDGTIMDVDISANAAISGSKIANSSITSDKINQANNWTFSQLTSTSANIRDISATNIEVSGNIVPLRDLSSNLGSSLKRWRNVFADDLSVNKINGVAYGGSSGPFTTSTIDISSITNVAQVGADISAGSGTTASAWFGRQVAISGNGECIIVAAPYTVVSGFNGVGSIKTYRYDVSNSDFINLAVSNIAIENSTNTWRQYGQEITSPTVNSEVYFGQGVSISHNGRLIAVSARGIASTIIYDLADGVIQSHVNLPGSVLWNRRATISAGGERVIFQPNPDPSFIIISNGTNTATGGDPRWPSGYIEVYNSNSNKTTWTRVGLRQEFTGSITQVGNSTLGICMSGDAKTIAYTVLPFYDSTPAYVMIKTLSGTNSTNWTWNQIATISRTTEIALGNAYAFGSSIAMSYDGLTLAINEPGLTINSTLRLYGRVKVYRYSNSSWSQLGISGSYISSSYKNLIFGSSVSLSPEGNILTVVSNIEYLPYGANIPPSEYTHAITVHIYDGSSNTWINSGPNIIKRINARLGSSPTVSSYLFGSSYLNNPVFRIAFGAWQSDANVPQNTTSLIFVRSYQYTITNSKRQSLLKFNAETTQTGSITISGDLIPNISPVKELFPIGVLNFMGPNYGCNIGSTQYRWNTIWSYYVDAFLGSFTCSLTTSDDRIKHNEVIINNGLDVIDKLCPKFYQKTDKMLDSDYNGDLSGHTWTYEAGLIAQELLQISDLSYVVSGGDYYDSTNMLIQEKYSVNYNSVFVYGLAAIKELHTKVKTQETTILSLQTSMLEQQTTINSLLTRLQALEANNI